MCDIWKGNHSLKQLTVNDVSGLLVSFKKFRTRRVVMSGGEALLNPAFFELCSLLQKENIKISLLSTGLAIKRYAAQIAEYVDDMIVSLDGDEQTHDTIRNIRGAFSKLMEGVQAVKSITPSYRITARTVIHRLNFRKWSAIIQAAKAIGIDQVSFLPADVSSHAFNREVLWNEERQSEIVPYRSELPELQRMIDFLASQHKQDFERNYIAESLSKLQMIHDHYAAYYGMMPYPYKKCNAPWVSAVIEADGSVKPCFFHESYGNIHESTLENLLNSPTALQFRKTLDMDKDPTCKKCVCYLNLPAWKTI
jgi:MoaA/NifB/PqqE/SkfB family radical SAM enzyme